ncbi:MAG TPA: retropepsin-like aspartic protease [Urbifossiella sp.]|nr:retropepsin-like aspartic protease [Urbifossiella sp.]
MSANTTYKSLAEGLPPDVARQIHPDWYKNEADYWAVRDSLLPQYEKQWIGFSQGIVIAVGRSPVRVLHEAHKADPHAFFVCVGHEYEPTRMRLTAFPYDTGYPGEPLPVVSVEFQSVSGQTGVLFDRVILDTGSDASAIPLADFRRLQLDPTAASPVYMAGVGGALVRTVQFSVWVVLDGTEYDCRLQVDSLGTERILGRDVLNCMDVLFRGPAAEVVINP